MRNLIEQTKNRESGSTTTAESIGYHYGLFHEAKTDDLVGHKIKSEEYLHQVGKTLAEAHRNLRKCGLK